MSKASANFLQGANAANAAVSAASASSQQLPDDAQILAAVDDGRVTDVVTLSSVLGVAAVIIEPLVEKLVKKGLIESTATSLVLSEAGARALRYINLAKF